MTVTVRDDLDFTCTTTSAMITFHSLQQTLMEESVLLLRGALPFEVMQADVKGLACDGVSVCSCITLLAGAHIQ